MIPVSFEVRAQMNRVLDLVPAPARIAGRRARCTPGWLFRMTSHSTLPAFMSFTNVAMSLPLDGRHRVHGLGVDDRLAHVAQRLVDGDCG